MYLSCNTVSTLMANKYVVFVLHDVLIENIEHHPQFKYSQYATCYDIKCENLDQSDINVQIISYDHDDSILLFFINH